MTEQEAIKELQYHIDSPFGIMVSEETCKLAIKALEKEFSVSREIRHGDYFCPKCGSHVDYQGYCHACGQKVY